MCSCHSILECCVTFSGVKLSIRSFVLFQLVIFMFVKMLLLNKQVYTNSSNQVKMVINAKQMTNMSLNWSFKL